MKRKHWELTLIFILLVILFATFLAVPAIRLLVKSFWGETGLTTEFYTSVLTAPQFGTALRNSFAVSAASALLAVGIAFVMAYLIHYTRLPRGIRRAIQAVATLPMFLPTITYGFAIIYSFGKQGLITRLLGHQIFNIYGFGGLLLGYVIYTVPVAFLLIHNTMGYVDKKTLVVSKAMGDGHLSTFWIAILRPLLGTLAGAFIQSFFLCFTDFGIPASVGGKYDVVATVLYNEMLGGVPDFNRGAVVAMVMLLPSIVSILLLRFLERYNIRYDRISDADLRPNRVRDTVWGLSGTVLSVGMLSIFAVIFVVPLVQNPVHPGPRPGGFCRQRAANGVPPLPGHGAVYGLLWNAAGLRRGADHRPEHPAQVAQAERGFHRAGDQYHPRHGAGPGLSVHLHGNPPAEYLPADDPV